MNHPLLEHEPDEQYDSEHLRTALGELNQILEDLKARPSTRSFATATNRVQVLGEFKPSMSRQWKTGQQKILGSVLLSQGVGTTDRSILSVGQTGTAIAFDVDTMLKYEAISIGKGNNLALAASPEGGLFACGGLGCTVDVYPINEALQADFGIQREPHDFNYRSEERKVQPEPWVEAGSTTASSTPTSGQFEKMIGGKTYDLIDPQKIEIQRQLMRETTEDALRDALPDPKVSRSHRFVPEGATSVTNLHASFMGHKGSIQALEFLDEYHLISGSADCTLFSWDLAVGHPVHLYTGHNGPVNEITAIDHNTFVSVGSDGYILLWDNRASQPQFSFESMVPGSINSVATIMPGMCFATAVAGHIGCFDVRSVNSLFYSQSAGANIEFVTLGVSDSGRVVAAGDYSGMCGVLDVLRGQWRSNFRAHNDAVTSVHVYGSTLLTTSYDSVVKQWGNQGE